MAVAALKPKPKTFHATMHVTRAEEWCVEAESVEEARELLAAGEGKYLLGFSFTHRTFGGNAQRRSCPDGRQRQGG